MARFDDMFRGQPHGATRCQRATVVHKPGSPSQRPKSRLWNCPPRNGIVTVVGNHDTDFSPYLTEKLVSRYESSFGPSNYFTDALPDATLVSVNAMALARPTEGYGADAWRLVWLLPRVLRTEC